MVLQENSDSLDSILGGASGHSCENCLYRPTEDECDMINNLESCLETLSDETKSSLVYITGYVFRRDVDEEDDTFLYFNKYGTFTTTIDRGGLKLLGDTGCKWTFMCYVLFNFVGVSKICRYSLSCLFLDVAFLRDFTSIKREHATTLANIFLNNYCRVHRAASDKEPKVKVLKLS